MDDDDNDCPNCEDLRSQIKLLREIQVGRKQSERLRWEQIQGLVQELLLRIELRIQTLT